MRISDANIGLEDPWHLVNIYTPLLVKEIPFPAEGRIKMLVAREEREQDEGFRSADVVGQK